MRVGCCTSLLYGGAPAKRIVVSWVMGPQLLALGRLSPREPPVPVAYVLAQLGLLNTELFTGDLRVRVAITVSLRVSLHEHDGLLICAVSALVGMEEADAIQRPFCEAVEPVDSALNRECRIAASSWGSPFLVIAFVRREF